MKLAASRLVTDVSMSGELGQGPRLMVSAWAISGLGFLRRGPGARRQDGWGWAWDYR